MDTLVDRLRADLHSMRVERSRLDQRTDKLRLQLVAALCEAEGIVVGETRARIMKARMPSTPVLIVDAFLRSDDVLLLRLQLSTGGYTVTRSEVELV